MNKNAIHALIHSFIPTTSAEHDKSIDLYKYNILSTALFITFWLQLNLLLSIKLRFF